MCTTGELPGACTRTPNMPMLGEHCARASAPQKNALVQTSILRGRHGCRCRTQLCRHCPCLSLSDCFWPAHQGHISVHHRWAPWTSYPDAEYANDRGTLCPGLRSIKKFAVTNVHSAWHTWLLVPPTDVQALSAMKCSICAAGADTLGAFNIHFFRDLVVPHFKSHAF